MIFRAAIFVHPSYLVLFRYAFFLVHVLRRGRTRRRRFFWLLFGLVNHESLQVIGVYRAAFDLDEEARYSFPIAVTLGGGIEVHHPYQTEKPVVASD